LFNVNLKICQFVSIITSAVQAP